MKKLVGLVVLVAAVAGCKGADRSARTGLSRGIITLPSGKESTPTTQDENRTVVALDPNATEAQLIRPAANSALSGVVVAVKPGSLSIPTDLVLQQGQSFDAASFLSELEISNQTVTGSGVPVSVTSTQPVDLAQPMVIAFPLPTAASLLAQTVDRARIALLYRIKVQTSGENLIGIVPGSQLSFVDDKVLYETKYFGWFQVVITGTPVQEAKLLQAKSVAGIALETVSKLVDLPSCGAADIGRTIYVLEESSFKYCASTGWTAIDLRGPKGDAGAQGQPGTAGAAGQNGADGLSTKVYGSDNMPFGKLVLDTLDNFLVRVVPPVSTTSYTAGFRQSDGKFVGSYGLNENLATGLDGKCFFTTPSCTGACYVVNPISEGIYAGPSGSYYKANRAMDTATASVQSYYAPVTDSCSASSPSMTTYQFYSIATPTAVGAFSWSGQPIYIGL
jgi:hypothetical protein